VDGAAGEQGTTGDPTEQQAPATDPVKKMRDALRGLGL
jgi:hypothetical protein